MTLEAIYRTQKPVAHPRPVYTVVWCGKDERAGACPVLLDLGRGPSAENHYGASQLAHAATYGMAARGLNIAL